MKFEVSLLGKRKVSCATENLMNGVQPSDSWKQIDLCYELIAPIGGSVLTVGLQDGGFLNLIKTQDDFQKSVGVETRGSKNAINLGSDFDIRQMDVTKLDLKKDEFDVVVCMNELEYLYAADFEKALSEFRRVAKKIVFLTIPMGGHKPEKNKPAFGFNEIIKIFSPTTRFFLIQPEIGFPRIGVLEPTSDYLMLARQTANTGKNEETMDNVNRSVCEPAQRAKISVDEIWQLPEFPRKMKDGLKNGVTKKIPKGTRSWIKKIEKRRAAMKASDTLLVGVAPIGGYVPGEYVEFADTAPRPLKDVVRAAKRAIWCRIIHQMVQEFKPNTVIELGTCVGISGSYIASAMPDGGVLYTFEGARDFADVAEETMQELGISDKVTFITGLFDNTLASALEKIDTIDFVFIDGHHDGDATLRYYYQIKDKLSEQTVVLFDDIRWSEDMLRAWNIIKEDGFFNLVVDMEEVGFCFKYPGRERAIAEVPKDVLLVENKK